MKLALIFALVSSSAKAISTYESGPSFEDQVEHAQIASKTEASPYYYDDDSGCDWMTEETCFDDDFNPVGCAKWEDGGCPCRDGETKCGEGWMAYCSSESVCCNWFTQETCYPEDGSDAYCANITAGGCPCPSGEEKCGGDGVYWSGFCTTLCCGNDEETCYDDSWNATSCAAIDQGGCPCPEGEEKCWGFDGFSGFCTKLCCGDDEETCYNDAGEPDSCAAIDDGGCPCPEGETKCAGAFGWPGYCTTLCCEELTCYDFDTWEPESCATWEEGCPSDSINAFDLVKEAVPKRGLGGDANKYDAIKLKEMKELAEKLAKKRASGSLGRGEDAAFMKVMKGTRGN
mmetsp:Transcript_2850/g.5362  ORF Transcript_2850/g.5362 Transcript_2850/m.5362 type:complete len:344 (-) Transcript_2850:310-1341(-)